MWAAWWSDFYDWVGWIGYASAFHIEIHSWKILIRVDEHRDSEWVSIEEINSSHDSVGDRGDMWAKCSIS